MYGRTDQASRRGDDPHRIVVSVNSQSVSHSPWGQSSESNGKRTFDPRRPVLNVAPLSCVPYMGPPSTHPSPLSIHQPAMVFLSSCPTDEEWNNIVANTKNGVALTGSAALGKVGPAIGAMDIGESEDEYVFRVSLPGVVRDEKAFSCDVEPNGRIVIKGVTATGERRVCLNSMVFEMQTQNLSPPGEFTVMFQLPGPIDHQQLTGTFGSDGIFEGVVKKRFPTGF